MAKVIDNLSYMKKISYITLMLLLSTGAGADRNGILKLAERNFNFNIFSSMESAWRAVTLPGADEILMKTSGAAVLIATSVWLPVKQNQVFNFLKNEPNRSKVLGFILFI